MNEPDPAFEKRVLLDIIEQMKDPAATLRKEVARRKAILAVGGAGVVIAFFLAINSLVHPFFVAVLAAVGGCVAGFAVFLEFAQKQWPVTRKYVDLDSVRRRLEELQGQAEKNT